MARKIIVLSEGTWETVGAAQILTITDDAYDRLVDGFATVSDLKEDSDITDIKEVE